MSKYIIQKNKESSVRLSKKTYFCIPNGTLDIVVPFCNADLYKCDGIRNSLKKYLINVKQMNNDYLDDNVFAKYINEQKVFDLFFEEYNSETNKVNNPFFLGKAEFSRSDFYTYHLPKTFTQDVLQKVKKN